MKLSYRDKVIFICAIVVIILIAGFFLFIKPKYNSMNLAKSSLEIKQSEKADVEAKINTLPELVEQLKASADGVNDVQSYFFSAVNEDDKITVDVNGEEKDAYKIEQGPYQYEQIIHDMLDSAGVDVRSILTTYTTGSQVSEYMVPVKNAYAYDLLMQADLYNELPQAVYDLYNKVAAETGDSIVIGVTNITVGYTDSFALTNLFKFVDAVADDERTMSILAVSSGEATEGATEAEGSIDMVLYSIMPLNVDKIMEENDTVEIVPVAETTEEPAA